MNSSALPTIAYASSIAKWVAAASGATLCAMLLIPYATNGLWFDDALNSQTFGMVHRFDTTWWDFSLRVLWSWLTEKGRVLFCWPWIYGFFYFVRDEAMVRLAHLGFLVAHIAVVVYLLRLVRLSWAAVGVFLLALFSMFQIRADDPVAAYATFSQVLGVSITLALVCLVKWVDDGRTWWLAAASGIASLSMLGYELNLVFFPVALGAVVMSRRPRRIANFLIVSTPLGCVVALNMIAKKVATDPYNGSAFGSLGDVPVTFAKQLVGTLPGSFYALAGHQNYPFGTLATAAVDNGVAWAIAVLGLLVCTLLARMETGRPLPASVWATAFVFLFVPPMLISLSAKYQAEIHWGQAHVPVYYQYFGLAALAALLFQRAGKGLGLLVLAPMIALHLALNWSMNMRQVAVFDAVFSEPRTSLVIALEHGLLAPVRDGDTVEIDGLPMFINGNLIYQAVQKRVYIPREAAIAGWFVAQPRADTVRYRLYRQEDGVRAWKLARIL